MPAKLRWQPPSQVSPTTIPLPNGYYNNRTSGIAGVSRDFASDEDVVLTMPGTYRGSGGQIVDAYGGRNVSIVGGASRGKIQWQELTGSLFLEGLIIDPLSIQDGLAFAGATGATPDIYIQNCLIRNIRGSYSGVHGDGIQPYGPVGNIYIHNCTITSLYQGIFCPPEYSITSLTISRTNIRWTSLPSASGGDSALLVCRGSDNYAAVDAQKDLYPVTFGPQVYVEPRKNRGIADEPGAAIRPAKGHTIDGADASPTIGSITAKWSYWTGEVIIGNPPNGDFAVEGRNCGLGYVSPGYIS